MEALLKALVEFVGTFIFLSVIAKYVKEGVKWAAFPIVLTLIGVIFWGGSISGGHFNPAVTTMFYIDNVIDITTASQYYIAQILGAYCAVLFSKIEMK
jgi:aquaporin Z